MKKMFLLLFTVIGLLALTACGTAGTEDEAIDLQDDNNSGEIAQGDENEGMKDSDSQTEAQSENGTNETAEQPETIREEATYVGMIDPHSIEVETKNDTIALQILDVKDVNFEAIEEDTQVVIEYYKNDAGQNILTKMEVK